MRWLRLVFRWTLDNVIFGIVLMAATIFPRDYYRAPRAWAEAVWPNLFYWNEVDRGGHFAAWEQPALFTDEVRKAFRSIRASSSN